MRQFIAAELVVAFANRGQGMLIIGKGWLLQFWWSEERRLIFMKMVLGKYYFDDDLMFQYFEFIEYLLISFMFGSWLRLCFVYLTFMSINFSFYQYFYYCDRWVFHKPNSAAAYIYFIYFLSAKSKYYLSLHLILKTCCSTTTASVLISANDNYFTPH